MTAYVSPWLKPRLSRTGMSYVVEVAAESLALTTMGQLKVGDHVNLGALAADR